MADPSLVVYAAASAAARLDAAVLAVGGEPWGRGVTVVAASRGAADDFARRLAVSAWATFGLSRFSLTQYVARTAMVALAGRGVAPATGLATEAVATRAAFAAALGGRLEYFSPVAAMPGFPRALARTLGELRGCSIDPSSLGAVPTVGADLKRLLQEYEEALHDARASDRVALFRAATEALSKARPGGVFVLLDVPLVDRAERDFVDALVGGADRVVATLAPGDDGDVFTRRGARIERGPVPDGSDLARLGRYLFADDVRPPRREPDGSLEMFSAPGEGRECVELVRRVLREARRGVRFDEMAILVRSPHAYFGLIEHAMARAAVPVWFGRGTRRPHPAGRAFLALLACASERLSATRFAEYLSLAQVPGERDARADWEPPADESTWRVEDRELDEGETEQAEAARETAAHLDRVVAGTLRAPWRWEALIVDARIIAGGAARWRRRFEGHRRELERRLRDAGREEGAPGGESPAGRRVEMTLEQLAHLEAFALPVVDVLESWDDAATWGEWLDRFAAFAPRVLRRPAQVLRVLAELRPMAEVGPIRLDEARRVLTERLLTVEAEAPSRRYGRVFVGTPHQARGRTFRVVFVPGLAERLFPQKPREDPLLLDAPRGALHSSLPTEPRRIHAERQLLQIAAGAASEHLCVSYPRLEVSEARPRVPSFYALDLVRAATGDVPAHQTLEENARRAGGATLAWPAPADPASAIDDVEYDLAVVRRLLDEPDRDAVKGHAHYLLNMNETLRRSVIERWRRNRTDWSPFDGVTRVTTATAPALAAERLTARAYSLSALQRFAACPYQFVLSAMLRLQPLDEPAPLERVDPLTRGSLVHEVQARVMRRLFDAGSLPLLAAGLAHAAAWLDEVVDDVAARAHEELAPAVERVWRDDVAAMRRDLHGWLARVADERDWIPAHFEFGFGRIPGERDPASSTEPVVLDGGYTLRGAIDLIERHAVTGDIRVTDYKTGRVPDKVGALVIGGGAVLQPVLYGLAAERVLGRTAREGRLFYCTSAGGFTAHRIVLDADARRAGLEVLEIIDRAVAAGHLMAAPAEHACERCDFLSVCGPDVGRRTARKRQEPLADLFELRSRR